VKDDHPRPSPVRGLWSFGAGGLFLAGLLVALDPITRPEDCPNYGGTGDGSVFADPAWNVFVPLLALIWIAATIVEQFLPFARRSRADSITRATAAIGISVIASCCGIGQLITHCG